MHREPVEAKTRLLGRPKVWLSVAIFALLCVAGAGVWLWSLLQTPEFEHPFDIEEFGYADIPDDENAFTAYLEASWLYRKPARGDVDDDRELVLESGWPAASQDLKDYLEANRPALEAWRVGTTKAEALYHQPESVTVNTLLPVSGHLRELTRLAALEGVRLEAEGKPVEAAGWYRAIFRSSRHSGRHAVLIERLIGKAMYSIAAVRLVNWSTNSSVNASQLRQARQEAIADYEMTEVPSTTVKAEYLMLQNSLSGVTFATLEEWGQITDPIELTRARLIEPDASRFAIAQVYGNWLRYVDLPRFERPRQRAERPRLFEPAAPEPPVRTLPPDQIERYFVQSVFARRQVLQFDRLDLTVTKELAEQAALIVALAAQEYYRNNGDFPETLDELAGDYLDEVPSDPFARVASQQMIYRRKDDGALVYSIGENETDDGGRFEPSTPVQWPYSGDVDVGFQIVRPRPIEPLASDKASN